MSNRGQTPPQYARTLSTAACLECQKSRFYIEATSEPPELAGGSYDTMARSDDGNRISAIRGPNGTRRCWTSDLFGNLSIRPGLTMRDREQCGPHTTLEIRTREIKLQGKHLALAGKVFTELSLSLEEDRVGVIVHDLAQAYTPRTVIQP
jgi:hypothetical protein